MLVTHDSFAISKPVKAAFERQTGLKLRILQTGDAGAALNRALLTAGKPEGDAFFGVDNNLLTRALDGDLLDPYTPSRTDAIDRRVRPRPEPPARRRRSRRGVPRLRPGLVRGARAGATPHARRSRASRHTAASLVVENPATSTPGLAFLLATSPATASGWRTYWQKLRANKVLVTTAGTRRTAALLRCGRPQGQPPDRRLVRVDPPAEVFFAGKPLAVAPTGVVLSSCFRQIEFAGVLRGAGNPAGARKLIDFMLSPASRPSTPVRCSSSRSARACRCPPVFASSRLPVPHPLELRAKTIGANRDRWIREVDLDRAPLTPGPHRPDLVGNCRSVPAAFLGAVLPLSARVDHRARADADGAFPLPEDILFSHDTARIAWFTVWQAAVSTALTLAAGMPLAWATARVRFRGRTLVRALVVVPFVLPTVVVATAFSLFSRRGSSAASCPILLAHVFFNVAVVVRVVGGYWSRLDPAALGRGGDARRHHPPGGSAS